MQECDGKREKKKLCDVNGEYGDVHPLASNVTHFNCILVSVNMLHEMLFQTKAVAVSMTLVLKFMCDRTDSF